MMLSPEGAQLLRAARDYILADPQHFNMAEWDCSSYACIGGWMCRLGRDAFPDVDRQAIDVEDDQLSRYCGFGAVKSMTPKCPLWELFYTWPDGQEANVNVAALRINAFLERYGYAPEVKEDAVLETV